MKKTTKNTEAIKDIREKVKDVISKELDRLPDLLEEMDAKDRVNILVKILPYTLPKTNTVRYDINETDNFDFI